MEFHFAHMATKASLLEDHHCKHINMAFARVDMNDVYSESKWRSTSFTTCSQ